MQALRPLHRNLIPIRRRDQAERGLLRQRAMPLPVEVHLPAKLAIPPGVLTRHVVDVDAIRRAGLDWLRVLPKLNRTHKAVALLRIGAGKKKGLAPWGSKRVAERSEHQEEEENHYPEERSRDEVQEPPLPQAPLRRWQIQVTHFDKYSDLIKPTFGSIIYTNLIIIYYKFLLGGSNFRLIVLLDWWRTRNFLFPVAGERQPAARWGK